MIGQPLWCRRATMVLVVGWASLIFGSARDTWGQLDKLEKPLRPPAVPLVTHDPYFSIWSPADRLTDADTVHWTGTPHRLQSMVRIDGQTYRLMGVEPKQLPALPQRALRVLPTQTIYEFQNERLRLRFTFTTPALFDNLDVLSRPVTYLTWDVAAADGKEHMVELYIECNAEVAVNAPTQEVVWGREPFGDLLALRIGSKEQPVLLKKGDNLRIDWGYCYLIGATDQVTHAALAPAAQLRKDFVAGQSLPETNDPRMPRKAEEAPAAALVLDIAHVGARPATRQVMLAYDDLYGIEYFKTHLRPYWRRGGMEMSQLAQTAFREYAALVKQCQSFDESLMADLEKAGGVRYARLAALAYRQALAGNKLVADAAGMPLLFPKENFSNGCIATVDVLYPQAPQFLLFSPPLTKAMLAPILDYAQSPRWRFPYAPHDLGTYPKANGQVYGGGEWTEDRQMPVEESGNMLLILAALAQAEGNADFTNRYWPLVSRWAEYLKEKGLDPENQLCTDDFAGHLAHNVNLSAKAVLALGAFGRLCEMTGRKAEAQTYLSKAQEYAARWVEMATDGDRTRLAFDKPGTWSQKYNLVWDRILGLNLFPPEVARREVAFYKKSQNPYGLPLDNRQTYTKLDWTIWCATLAEKRSDFEALVDRSYAFLQSTPQRVPMTDWHWTLEPKQRGFVARPVVGGVFIPLLADRGLWQKWVKLSAKVSGDWAKLALAPPPVMVVSSGKQEAVEWKYTTQKPADNWFAPDFKDADWKKGQAGFGNRATPRAVVRTKWDTADIWLRREFTLAPGQLKSPRVVMFHDEDAEVYINGVKALTVSGYINSYDDYPIAAEAAAAIKEGKNVLAVHCRQTSGGQFIDVGLAGDAPPPGRP